MQEAGLGSVLIVSCRLGSGRASCVCASELLNFYSVVFRFPNEKFTDKVEF